MGNEKQVNEAIRRCNAVTRIIVAHRAGAIRSAERSPLLQHGVVDTVECRAPTPHKAAGAGSLSLVGDGAGTVRA